MSIFSGSEISKFGASNSVKIAGNFKDFLANPASEK